MIKTQESFEELIASGESMSYVVAGDPRSKRAQWNVYGDGRHNMLWVILTNTKTDKSVYTCELSKEEGAPIKFFPDGLREGDGEHVELIVDFMWDKFSKTLKL